MKDELDRKRQQLASTAAGGKTPAPVEGDPARCGPEHGIREGAGGDRPPSRNTQPDRATRFLEPKGEVEGLWLRVEGLKLSGLRTLAWSPRG